MTEDERVLKALQVYSTLNGAHQYAIMVELGVPLVPWKFQTVQHLRVCFRWLYLNGQMETFITQMIGNQ